MELKEEFNIEKIKKLTESKNMVERTTAKILLKLIKKSAWYAISVNGKVSIETDIQFDDFEKFIRKLLKEEFEILNEKLKNG